MATADVGTNISISATVHQTLSLFISVSKIMKWFKLLEIDIFLLYCKTNCIVNKKETIWPS